MENTNTNNTSKIIIIAVIVIIVIIGVAFAMKSSPSTPTPSESPTPTPTEISTTTDSTREKTYTLADIAKHAVKADCWTIINGNVYDLTAFIPNHPGGDRILVVCGKDGTAAFTNQHDTQENPNKALAMFKIGILTQ